MNRKEFGELLAALRQDLGWTQSELAEYAQLDDPVISQIERGVKKYFEPELLFCLANALQLTTMERREFILAASGLDEKQVVRQPAQGTTTDTFHPSKIMDGLVKILGEVRAPAFLNDVYGDVIAANVAIIRFFNVPDAMIESASRVPAGYNSMRMTFNKDLVGRTHVSDNWDRCSQLVAHALQVTSRAEALDPKWRPVVSSLYHRIGKYSLSRGDSA